MLLSSTPVLYRTTRWFPLSATHRLPAGSNATARGWFSELLEGVDAVRLLKLGCPYTASGSIRVGFANGDWNELPGCC